MPYTPVSNLSRRGEKIAPFVSVQNALGMVALAAIGWVASAAFPGPVQFFLTLLLAGTGYLITMDVKGMSLYERVLWQLRGRMRMLLRGKTLAPEDLPGTVVQTKLAVTRRGGPVRLRLDSPTATARQRSAITARTTAPRRLALARLASEEPVVPVALVVSDGAAGLADGPFLVDELLMEEAAEAPAGATPALVDHAA